VNAASAELAFLKSFAVSIKDIAPQGTLTSRCNSWVRKTDDSNDWFLDQGSNPAAHNTSSISLRRDLGIWSDFPGQISAYPCAAVLPFATATSICRSGSLGLLGLIPFASCYVRPLFQCASYSLVQIKPDSPVATQP
jgi:hypothetical protein